MDGAVFKTQGNHSTAFSFLHEQVEGKVFDKVVAVIAQGLPVERVQQRVACAVSDAAAP